MLLRKQATRIFSFQRKMAMARDDWEEVYQYVSDYGMHIALWAFLSAVTIYRREMSVNRLYHKDEEEGIVAMKRPMMTRATN